MMKQVIPLYPAEGSTLAKTYLSAQASQCLVREPTKNVPASPELEIQLIVSPVVARSRRDLRLGSVQNVVSVRVLLCRSLECESIGSYLDQSNIITDQLNADLPAAFSDKQKDPT
jgi:hypothetical protein